MHERPSPAAEVSAPEVMADPVRRARWVTAVIGINELRAPSACPLLNHGRAQSGHATSRHLRGQRPRKLSGDYTATFRDEGQGGVGRERGWRGGAKAEDASNAELVDRWRDRFSSVVHRTIQFSAPPKSESQLKPAVIARDAVGIDDELPRVVGGPVKGQLMK